MLMKGKIYVRDMETTHKYGQMEGLPLEMKWVTLEVRDFSALTDEDIDALTEDDFFVITFPIYKKNRKAWDALSDVHKGDFYAVYCERLVFDGEKYTYNCINPVIMKLDHPEYLLPSKIEYVNGSSIETREIRHDPCNESDSRVRLPQINDNMFYLFDYREGHECSPEDAYVREWIWNVKDSKSYAQSVAASIIEKAVTELSNLFTGVDNVALVAVPASKKSDPLHLTSIQKIIKMVVEMHNPTSEHPEKYINRSFLLRRKCDVPTSHLSFDKRLSEDEHYDSISVCVDSINKVSGKTVYIIIDDVYTYGNTMRACKKLLEDTGLIDSSNIFCLTLGKTTRYKVALDKVKSDFVESLRPKRRTIIG